MSFKINYQHVSSTPKDWLYKCKACNTEFYRQFTVQEMPKTVTCECGATAGRHINKATLPRIELDPISGDHVGATDKWIKKRESKMKQEKKNMENHGTYD